MSARNGTGTAVEATRGARRNAPAWVLLLLVCVGQFMVVLDISIVNVALPSIQTDLGFSVSGLQWVVNAYTLTFAGFLLLGGRAADLFGRRRMFVAGLGMFTAASFLGGLAQTQGQLIGARVLQGLGGAILAPATLTIITTTFREGSERARALGIWSAVAAAGASAGALLGGILTDVLSWRWILFVNVPIGLASIVAARAFLPESRAEGLDRRHLDIAGAVTVTIGLVSLVYSIVQTESYGWTSARVLVPLAVALVFLGAFAVIEGRVAISPLVPFRIFRSRSLTSGNVFIGLFFAGMFGAWYFETLYMQSVLGFTPLQAGLAFLPQTLLIAILSQVSSRLIAGFGTRRLMVAGSTIAAAGLLWLSRITPESSFLADLLGPFLLIGAGMGLSITPVVVATTSGVEPSDAGLASGLLNTSRIVGAAIGLAVLATVAASRTAAVLGEGVATPARQAAALTAGYSRGLVISTGILLASAAVALLAMPSLQRGRSLQPAPEAELALVPVAAEEPELESA